MNLIVFDSNSHALIEYSLFSSNYMYYTTKKTLTLKMTESVQLAVVLG